MSISYELFKLEKPEIGTVARIIRDDATGSLVEIVSGLVVARVKVVDLIKEINSLEEAKTAETEATKNEEG